MALDKLILGAALRDATAPDGLDSELSEQMRINWVKIADVLIQHIREHGEISVPMATHIHIAAAPGNPTGPQSSTLDGTTTVISQRGIIR